jgi:DNA-binding transcriptional regulator YiaG
LKKNPAFGRIGFMKKEERKEKKDEQKELAKRKNLKEFRERLDMTQGELAEALTVAINTISRWELGTRSIPEFLPLALLTIERQRFKKPQSTAKN